VYLRISKRRNTLNFLQSQRMGWLLQDSMVTAYLRTGKNKNTAKIPNLW